MPKEKVKKVLDGDTFVTTRGRRVRLADVDAAELGQRGGQGAKEKLADEIEGETVNINVVGKSYGRDVAEVRKGRKSVNQTMRRSIGQRKKK